MEVAGFRSEPLTGADLSALSSARLPRETPVTTRTLLPERLELTTIKGSDGRFSGSIEELVLRLGFAIVILWLASCLATAYYLPDCCMGMLRSVGYHALGGRAAGITAGLDAGLHWWLVVGLAFATDLAAVFLLYPVVVYSYENGARRWFMRGTIDSTVEAARTGRKGLARWGIVGIVFFVWFPFYMTGPLVGAVIGYFLGMRTWVTMTAVGSGTLLAIISWTFIFDWLLGVIREHAKGYASYLPLAVVALVLAGLAAVRVRMWLRKDARESDQPYAAASVTEVTEDTENAAPGPPP